MNRPKLVALLIAATTLATSCATQTTEKRATTNTRVAAPVIALSGVDQFATTFNADKGVPRLILPISPT